MAYISFIQKAIRLILALYRRLYGVYKLEIEGYMAYIGLKQKAIWLISALYRRPIGPCSSIALQAYTYSPIALQPHHANTSQPAPASQQQPTNQPQSLFSLFLKLSLFFHCLFIVCHCFSLFCIVFPLFSFPPKP